ERVLYRLNWGKVIGGGIVSGAWLGLFLGLLLSLFTAGSAFGPLLVGLIGGIIFGLITATIPYAATRGQRDFASTMQLVAGRYDVLCDPRTAEQARDLLARLAIWAMDVVEQVRGGVLRHFGVDPSAVDAASVTFLGLESIEILRIASDDLVHYATLGGSRHPMGDPA